ncbi:MAG: hypothetical protein ACRDTT_13805, partial [Pseudonocardiaceae bacterium]
MITTAGGLAAGHTLCVDRPGQAGDRPDATGGDASGSVTVRGDYCADPASSTRRDGEDGHRRDAVEVFPVLAVSWQDAHM